MMDDKIYQLIFDEIAPLIHVEWEKIVIYLEYGEDSYSFSFFYHDGKKYNSCFDMPNTPENVLFSAFGKIDKAVTSEREKNNGNLWSNMTMIVNSDGNMHIDFDYTDLSSNAYSFKKSWKKKYLV